MQEPRLIINADDFGYSSPVNTAIVSCFNKELINSTTIMANMENFEEAVSMAYQHGFNNQIGIHINLTEGKPLTDLSGTDMVDQKGRFIMGHISKPFSLFSASTLRKIKREMREQYHKVLNSGIVPTHIDSHQHVHTLPMLAPVFISFAKENNQKIRVAWVFKRKNFIKSGQQLLLNAYIKKNNLNFTDRFTNIRYLKDDILNHRHEHLSFEIMVHPAYQDSRLIDILEKSDIEQEIRQLKQLYSTKVSLK